MTPEEEKLQYIDDLLASDGYETDGYVRMWLAEVKQSIAAKDAQISSLEKRLKELGDTTMEIIKND